MKDIFWDKNIVGCQECVILEMCKKNTPCKVSILGKCFGGTGSYQFQKPKPIQSEYDWVEERTNLLSDHGDKDFHDEFVKHELWLRENKPTNFVTCTKENTKVGDTIKGHLSGSFYEVELIYREQNDVMVLWNINTGTTITACMFTSYLIDITGKE